MDGGTKTMTPDLAAPARHGWTVCPSPQMVGLTINLPHSHGIVAVLSVRRAGAGRLGRKRMPVDSQYYQAEQANLDIAAQQPQPAQPDAEAERVSRELWGLRNEQGQWRTGVSGNPAGRPRGARNRVTL